MSTPPPAPTRPPKRRIRDVALTIAIAWLAGRAVAYCLGIIIGGLAWN